MDNILWGKHTGVLVIEQLDARELQLALGHNRLVCVELYRLGPEAIYVQDDVQQRAAIDVLLVGQHSQSELMDYQHLWGQIILPNDIVKIMDSVVYFIRVHVSELNTGCLPCPHVELGVQGQVHVGLREPWLKVGKLVLDGALSQLDVQYQLEAVGTSLL